MQAKAPLPKAVNAVGERIGLDYNIDRKTATKRYVDDTQQATRIGLDQLRNTFYSLTEAKTKKGTEKKKTHQVKKKNPLKLNSRTRKKLYRLSNEERRKLEYSTFEKVHDLWQQYAARVVKESDLMSVFRMDLHGCKIRCTACKNPTLVGIEGIVVQETKNTFLVIKQTNRLLTLPKRESVFKFRIGVQVYKIHGCNLLFTTQTRSKVKYKQKKCLMDI